MIMGGKHGLSPDLVMNKLNNRLGQSHTIISGRPTPQLIKNNQGIRCPPLNSLISLHHLNHKGRLT